MNLSMPSGIGALISLLGLVVTIVLLVMGQLPLTVGLLFAAAFLSRLC